MNRSLAVDPPMPPHPVWFAPAPGRALAHFFDSQLDAAVQWLSGEGEALHEGVHQGRKCIRRARAVLALGSDRLGGGATLIDEQLQQLNESLSQLRDASAVVEVLRRLERANGKAADREHLRELKNQAELARSCCLEVLLAQDPALAGRRERLATLRAAATALHWDAVSDLSLHSAMARSDERTRKARERAMRSQDVEDWHRWRRRARRAAQQRHALEDNDLASAAATRDPFGKRVAEQLGRAQDLALLLAACRPPSVFGKADRQWLKGEASQALGRLRSKIHVAAKAEIARRKAALASDVNAPIT